MAKRIWQRAWQHLAYFGQAARMARPPKKSEAIMCGRVRLSSDYSDIKIRLKFAPNSVAPNLTAPMLVAIRSVNGERVPKMMKWGLIPHWAKDATSFNIRPSTRVQRNLRRNPRFGMRGRAASGASLSLMVSMSGKSLMQTES